jgi:putative transposase
VSPSRRRHAVVMLQDRLGISERRACRIVGQHRSTQRHQPDLAPDDAALRAELRNISRRRPRWGYRRAHQLPLEQGGAAEPQAHATAVARGRSQGAAAAPQAPQAGHVDRASAAAAGRASGSCVRTGLPVRSDRRRPAAEAAQRRDEFTREALAIECRRRIDADHTVTVLDRLVDERGTTPAFIRCGNGAELTATPCATGAASPRPGARTSSPARGGRNPYIESFGSRLRYELLAVELFSCLAEAQVVIEDWRQDYNQHRPHSALGMMTPSAFRIGYRTYLQAVSEHLSPPGGTAIARWNDNNQQPPALTAGGPMKGVWSCVLIHDEALAARCVVRELVERREVMQLRRARTRVDPIVRIGEHELCTRERIERSLVPPSPALIATHQLEHVTIRARSEAQSAGPLECSNVLSLATTSAGRSIRSGSHTVIRWCHWFSRACYLALVGINCGSRSCGIDLSSSVWDARRVGPRMPVRAGSLPLSARRAGISVMAAIVGLLGYGAAARGAARAVPIARTAAVSPAQGRYSGFTSQAGDWSEISFRVSGSSLRDYTVLWRATCRSGRSLLSGTITTGLRVIAGAWKARTGTYVLRLARGAYRAKGTVTGSFRVLANSGRFTSLISATGIERVTGTLYQHGLQIDSCATGPVSWTAGNTSAHGSSSPLIVPEDATISGFTYAQWSTDAWQWSIANLHSHRSKAPQMSTCVTNGQQGPVWFPESDRYDLDLADRALVTCHLPRGQYVFLTAPSYECSTVERPPFYATSDAGLIRCAHVASASTLLFDGRLLSPSGFPISTGVFPFTMPASTNLLEVPGVTSGRGAAYGRPMMLGPLPAGVHTITEAFRYRGPAFVGTVRLIVS